MALQIINIYIYSRMRGARSTEPKCIYVIEDDSTRESRAYIRRFTDAMTNNQLAVSAVVTALSRVSGQCEIHLYTDSSYVAGTFADDRLNTWRQHGWKNAKGKEVMNRELWEQVLKFSASHVLCVEHNVSNSVYLWMEEQIKKCG